MKYKAIPSEETTCCTTACGRHLQTHYPFLFSPAMRTNPLDPRASVTVID